MVVLFMAGAWDPTPWREAFARYAPEFAFRVWPDVGDPAGITHALVWNPEPGVLANFPNLKSVVSLAAGVDHLMSDPELPDLPLIRLVDSEISMRMSEYVITQVLLHHRQHLRLAAQQRNRLWNVIQQPPANEVRVGIMGLGALGADAAVKLTMIGYDVAGWSRSPKEIAGVTCFSGEAGFDSFLARTDILVCLLPLTEGTRGILNMETFRKLARRDDFDGPVLVNAGRGGSHVESDIIKALEDSTLKGASLDVFEVEPLPEDSPLWSHPGVVITPHMAADPQQDRVVRYIVSQLRRVEEDLAPEAIVSRQSGY